MAGPGPSEEELEAMAERLVGEALSGFEQHFTPAALARIRESLVDELMCTSYGRTQLRYCLSDDRSVTSGSDEQPIDEAMLALMDKVKGQIR
jgi:hypothetical protein